MILIKQAHSAGVNSSSSDRFFITVKGKNSHGSQPENGIDAIVIAAQIITALQSVVARTIGPLDNAVVTYGKMVQKIAALKPNDAEPIDQAAFEALKQKFLTALGNDLNTSLAITAVYDVLKYKTNDQTKLAILADFDTVLGLDLIEKADKKRKELAAAPKAGAFTIISESGETDAAVEALIQARQDAKKAKNFAEADRIREELKSQGIEVTDVACGAKWKRI